MRDDLANNVLSTAISQGIIDAPTVPNYGGFFSHLQTLKEEKQRDPTQQKASQSNPLRQAESRRYVDHYFPKWTQIGNVEIGYQPALVEIARITVPPNHVGYLRLIDQALCDWARYEATYDWKAFPSSYYNGGITWFDEWQVDLCRWFLRVEPFRGVYPDRLVISPCTNPDLSLPGAPYSELPYINNIWFPAHNNRPMWSLIPAATTLRFFFYTPHTDDYQWSVMGKLSGVIQSENCHEAVFGERTGWNS